MSKVTPTSPEIHKCIQTPWLSIYIAAAICLTVALQQSLYFSSIWPYLRTLDPGITENFFGFIIGSYSLGQIILSPLMGFWSNKTKTIKLPLIACLLLSAVGNILYISAGVISHNHKYVILTSRFIVGLGAASVGLLRTYAATSSTTNDRTKAIAFITGGFALGMSSGPVNAGPATQLAFVPLEYPGFVIVNKLSFSMYSAPAYFGIMVNVIGIILIRFCFKEEYAGILNKLQIQENGEVKKVNLPAYDKLSVLICYCTRFTQMFVYTNLETIGAPFVMSSYALTRSETVKYLAIAHSVLSGLAFLVYLSFVIFKLDKFIKLRKHIIISLSGLMLFHFITFAYPIWPKIDKIYTDTNSSTVEQVGCNSRLQWCKNITPPNFWLYIVSFSVFIGICFPNINLSLGTLFSHIIGPRRQATQQGLMQMCGSLARLSGPIVISNLYSSHGPRWAWLVEIVVLTLTILLWIICYKRMVPLKLEDETNSKLRL